MNLEEMIKRLRKMSLEREWQNFHTPKNLVMALGGEAGELLEIFQWLTDDEAKKIMTSEKTSSDVRDEVADIFTYLLRICDVLNIDLESAFWQKIAKTEAKYPVSLAKGNAKKYTEF